MIPVKSSHHVRRKIDRIQTADRVAALVRHVKLDAARDRCLRQSDGIGPDDRRISHLVRQHDYRANRIRAEVRHIDEPVSVVFTNTGSDPAGKMIVFTGPNPVAVLDWKPE